MTTELEQLYLDHKMTTGHCDMDEEFKAAIKVLIKQNTYIEDSGVRIKVITPQQLLDYFKK